MLLFLLTSPKSRNALRKRLRLLFKFFYFFSYFKIHVKNEKHTKQYKEENSSTMNSFFTWSRKQPSYLQLGLLEIIEWISEGEGGTRCPDQVLTLIVIRLIWAKLELLQMGLNHLSAAADTQSLVMRQSSFLWILSAPFLVRRSSWLRQINFNQTTSVRESGKCIRLPGLPQRSTTDCVA